MLLGAGDAARADAVSPPQHPDKDALAELKTRLHGRAGLRAELRRDHRRARDDCRATGSTSRCRSAHLPAWRWPCRTPAIAGSSTKSASMRADRSPWRAIRTRVVGAAHSPVRTRSASSDGCGRNRLGSSRFPQPPRVIDVSARGWTASGVNEGRLVSGSLELAREEDAERSSTTLEAGAEFPAFVRVDRVFNLDLDWTVDTFGDAHRAPARGAVGRDSAGDRRIGTHRRRESARQRSRRTRGSWARANRSYGGTRAWRGPTRWKSRCPRMRARTEVWSFVGQSAVERGLRRVSRRYCRRRERSRMGVPIHAAAGRNAPAQAHASSGCEGRDARDRFGEPGDRHRQAFVEHDAGVQLSQHAGRRHIIKLPVDARDFGRASMSDRSKLRPEGRAAAFAGARRAPLPDRLGRIPRREPDTQPSQIDCRLPPAISRRRSACRDSRWVLAAWGPGVDRRCSTGASSQLHRSGMLLEAGRESAVALHRLAAAGLGLSTQSWFVF